MAVGSLFELATGDSATVTNPPAGKTLFGVDSSLGPYTKTGGTPGGVDGTVTLLGITVEALYDLIGGMFTDSSDSDFTFDDPSDTVTVTIKTAAVTNAKLANMAALTVKGSVAGGVPADLTPAQVTTNFVVPDGSTLEIASDQIRQKDAGTTNAKLANMAQATFKMRAASAGTGAPIDGTAAQAKTALAITAGDVSGLATIATSGSGADLTANTVSDAKLRQGAARSVIGVTGNATANVADIVGTTDQVLRINTAGTALGFGTIATGGLTNNAVSNAKMAQMVAHTFKGNNTGSTADPLDLTQTQLTAELNAATTLLQGAMSAADKIKLNNVWVDVVAQYGADPTGAVSSQTAITNAITAMPASGGVLYFPPGTYAHTATITVDKPIIFMGSGRAITNVTISHASQDQFDFVTGSQGAGFEQIRLTGATAGTRTGGYAVDMNAIPNLYMQQCDILFHHSGVRSAGALQFLDDLNIREGGANAASGAAIFVDAFGDRYIRRITTDQGSDPTGYAGVRVRQCSSLVLTDCNLINSTNALDIVPNGGGGTAVASILATGTFFDSSVIGVNILPATASDTAHRIRFVNCWFGSNTTANFRMGNGTIPNANIAAIDIIGCDFFGGGVSGLGLDVLGVTDWSVRGSRFGGHTNKAIQVAVGTGSADHRFSITDNVIGNVLGGGTNAQGITIGAGTYGAYQILDNRGLDQNTTPGIADSGSVGATSQKNVANNVGCIAGPLQPLASGGGSVIAGRGAVTSGTGETFLATFRIPANSVSVGDVLHLTAQLQSSSTGTCAPRIRCGAAGTIADALVNVTGTSAAGTANSWINLNAYIYIIALGAAGTVYASIQGTSTAAAFNNGAVAEAPGNVTTTGAWFITFSAAASAGTYTVRSIRMRII